MELYSQNENYKLYHGNMLDMLDVLEPNTIDTSKYYGFIYITINSLNNKMYIGKKKFVSNWKTYLGSGLALKKAINKYGKNNFYRVIIDLAKTPEELCEKEINYIEKNNAVLSTMFYNEACGGIGGDTFSGRSEESKEKTRKKMGKKGKEHWLYNKHLSQKIKDKISQKKGKKVICLENNTIYNSTRDVERKTGIHHEDIGLCCRGKIKTCCGYHWKYVDDLKIEGE